MGVFRVERDTKGLVKVVWENHSNHTDRFALSTGVKVSQENFHSGRVLDTDPHHKFKNEVIKEYFSEIISLVIRCNKQNNQTNAKLLEGMWSARQDGVNFDYVIQYKTWAESKYLDKGYSEQTLKNVMGHANLISEFEAHRRMSLDVSVFDKATMDELVVYMQLHKQYTDQHVLRQVRMVKTFLSERYPVADWGWIKYRPMSTRIHWLNDSDIQLLQRTQLEPRLNQVREMLLVMIGGGLSLQDMFRRQKFVRGFRSRYYELAIELYKDHTRVDPDEERFEGQLREVLYKCEIERQVETDSGQYVPLYMAVSGSLGFDTYVMEALIRGYSPYKLFYSLPMAHWQLFYPYIRERNRYNKELKKFKGF